MHFYVLSLRIKYNDSENQKNSIVIYTGSKINVNSGLFIFPTKNTSKPNNIIWTYHTQFEILAEYM